MCPKGDDPLTLNQNYRSIRVRITTEYFRFNAGPLGIEFQGTKVYLDLTNPSSEKCATQMSNHGKFGQVGCEYVRYGDLDDQFTFTFYNWPLYPVDNNLYTNDGNPSIYEFFCDISLTTNVLCEFTDVSTENIREYATCSNRGVCDFSTGLCACNEGFGGPACSNATYLYYSGASALPGLDVTVEPTNFTSSVLYLSAVKSKAPDFYFINALANNEQVFYVTGDGVLGVNRLETLQGGQTISNGGLYIAAGGVTVNNDGLNVYSDNDNSPLLKVDSGYAGSLTDTFYALQVSTDAPNANNHFLFAGINQDVTKFLVRADGGVFIKGGGLRVTTGATVYSGGLVVTGGVTINSGGLSIKSGGISVTGYAKISQGLSVTAGGFQLGGGGVTIGGGGMRLTGGQSVQSGGLVVTGGGTVNGGLRVVSGVTIASSGLVLTGGVTVSSLGINIASGGLTVGGSGGPGMKIVNGGLTILNTGLVVTSGGLTLSNGHIYVSGGMTVAGATGLNVPLGGLSVGGNALFSSGLTVSSDGISISAGGLTVAGAVSATGNVNVVGDTQITGSLGVTASTSLNFLQVTANAVVGNDLIVTGGLSAYGNSYVFTSSDRRLKKKIAPIDKALEKVKKLSGVYFHWDRERMSSSGMNSDDRRHVGFIAQEIKAVLPEALSNPDVDDEAETAGSDGRYLGVDYGSIGPLLVEAMHELEDKVDAISVECHRKICSEDEVMVSENKGNDNKKDMEIVRLQAQIDELRDMVLALQAEVRHQNSVRRI